MSTRVVVGIDGSAPSRIAVHWAARNAERRGAALTFVHAAPTHMTPLVARWKVLGQHELPHERLQRVIDDAINIAIDSTRNSGLIQVTTKVVFTDAVDILVDLSRDAELVVVGSHNRCAVRRTLFASVSSQLIRRCHCPVAVIHDARPRIPHPGHAPVRARVTGW